LKWDIHFHTNTTIDTLDYSGTGLNSGSKVVFAAYGDKRRELVGEVPVVLNQLQGYATAKMVMPGIIALQAGPFTNYEAAVKEMEMLNNKCSMFDEQLAGNPLIIICDDAGFTSQRLNNFLWVTFTRCNPSHDIYGVNSFTENKHWGCRGPLLIDARIKPHHAPPVQKDEAIEKNIDRLFENGRSLHSINK
jgi:4-hydroxy-3-polyprenylbenzoate decarboxylase